MHGVGEAPPFADFFRQLFASRCRQVVEARATIVVGDPPFAADPAGGLEPLECRVERSVVHEEGALRRVLDGERDAVAVVRAEGQRAQNQEVERPLQERGAGGFFL